MNGRAPRVLFEANLRGELQLTAGEVGGEDAKCRIRDVPIGACIKVVEDVKGSSAELQGGFTAAEWKALVQSNV